MNRLKIWLLCRSRFVICFILALVGVFYLGYIRMDTYQKQKGSTSGDYIGRIVKPPESYKSRQRLLLVSQNNRTLRVFTVLFPEYQRGQVLQLTIDESEDVVFDPQIKIISEPSFIYSIANSFRNEIIKKTKKAFSEPFDSLVLGVVFGIDYGLTENVSELMRRAGLTHILVASGYNITVLLSFFQLILSKKSKLFYAGVILPVLFLYGSLGGFDPPVTRAVIMAIGLIFASLLGRQYSSYLWLVYSGCVLILWNPSMLFSISFQLTFAATIAMVLVCPRVESLFRVLPPFLREALSASIAVSILTFPVIYFSFGTYAFWGVAINALIGWLIPVIFILSVVCITLLFTFPLAAVAWITTVEFLFRIILFVAGLAS